MRLRVPSVPYGLASALRAYPTSTDLLLMKLIELMYYRIGLAFGAAVSKLCGWRGHQSTVACERGGEEHFHATLGD